MNSIVHYLDESGCIPFQEWADSIKDKRTKAKITFRLAKVAAGTLGDHRPCRDGVWELRENFGPGYRLYYAMIGKTVVLLLCGGDKGSQSSDIDHAVAYLNDYQKRNSI